MKVADRWVLERSFSRDLGPGTSRLAVGPEHRRLVPLSLVGGAVFVLACDLVCRAAGGLRLGIVTALVGGPFFLVVLRRLGAAAREP